MISQWKINIFKGAVKGILPFQSYLRRIKRKITPYKDSQFNTRFAFEQGIEQIKNLKQLNTKINGTVLEFGSGWLPIIPILFYIYGANEIVLADIERLMDARTIDLAKDFVKNNISILIKTLGGDERTLIKRLDMFKPIYLVPWKSSEFPSESVDIVISRAVLEHVPPTGLKEFLIEFRRIVRSGGIMCHTIDNSDHWQHHDHSLSRINFLRFEDHDFWWKIGTLNTQNYQNRLRHSDYCALFERTGWKIIMATGDPDPQCINDLQSLPIASKYRPYNHVDLAILTSNFILQKS